jgi:hypothetical protein
MPECSIFVAADGSIFTDPRRCSAYEELLKALENIDRNSLSALRSGQPALLLTWVDDADSGDNKLDRMLALYYLAYRLFGELENVNELLNDAFSYEISGWKSKYKGIAGEFVNLPGNASREVVGRLLRKYDTNRISCVLEAIEDSEIPLRIYKMIKEYLP